MAQRPSTNKHMMVSSTCRRNSRQRSMPALHDAGNHTGHRMYQSSTCRKAVPGARATMRHQPKHSWPTTIRGWYDYSSATGWDKQQQTHTTPLANVTQQPALLPQYATTLYLGMYHITSHTPCQCQTNTNSTERAAATPLTWPHTSCQQPWHPSLFVGLDSHLLSITVLA
jgi:hypothetical protein